LGGLDLRYIRKDKQDIKTPPLLALKEGHFKVFTLGFSDLWGLNPYISFRDLPTFNPIHHQGRVNNMKRMMRSYINHK
jgi:hypothetical protein